MANAQTSHSCKTEQWNDYLIDGQSYYLELNETPRATIYIVFFKGFDYRLKFCSQNFEKYTIKLYDIEKKLLVTENCNHFEKYIHIRFNSNIASIIEIEPIINQKQDTSIKGSFYFTVGFKENNSVETK
jgi:hypothetical protein